MADSYTPKPGKLLPAKTAEMWITPFLSRFRPPSRKYLNSKLPIPSNLPTACLLKGQEIKADFSNLTIPEATPVFALFEYHPELYETTLREVLNFLNNRQPWESYDFCIFDQSLEWCLGISHNDRFILSKGND